MRFWRRHIRYYANRTQLDNPQHNSDSFTELIVLNNEWFDPQLMATKEINQYYDATASRQARADLAFAVSLLPKSGYLSFYAKKRTSGWHLIDR